MAESLYAKPDLTKKVRYQREAKEERNEGVYGNTDDTMIYDTVGEMVVASEDLQKPTEDKFQGSQNVSNAPEKRNPCRTVGVGLGLLTLLLLAGITGLGIHYFHEKTDWGVKRGLLLEGNANLSSARDQIQASYNIAAEEAKKLKSENYNLTQRISHSELEVAQLQANNSNLQAVNSDLTAQRDELQEILDGRKCCPQNWLMFCNHCYYVSTSYKTWEESKKDCENRDANLVIIRSAEEQEFISGLGVRAWIGLDRQEDGEHWEWVDGSPVTTTYWAPGQPDNYGNIEDCGETYGDDFLWNDVPCGHLDRWICKI